MISVSGHASLRLDGELLTISHERLTPASGGHTERGMGNDRHHIFTYEDEIGRKAEWTVSEYPVNGGVKTYQMAV